MNRFKMVFFSFFISILAVISCSLVSAEESISITTYYPSPYGVYNELRLFPHAAPVTLCGPTTEGTMFFNNITKQLQICNSTGWTGPGGDSFWESAGDDIFNTNPGNVGIGTSSPVAPLHVYAATGYGEIRVESVDPTRGADVHYKADGREWGAGAAGSNYGALSNGFFITDQTANGGLGLVRLAINTAGYVGLGTTNPTTHLTIYGDAAMKLQSDNNPSNYSDIHFDNTLSGGREYVIGNYGPNSGGGTLANKFFIRDNAGADRVIINPSGNVGIGTIDPRTLLHLKRANEIDIWIEGNSPDVKFIHLPGTYYTWRMGLDDDNGNFRFSKNQKNSGDPDQVVTDDVLVITPGGDVIAAGGSWMVSDRAHKKDIDYNFQYGLKTIEQLKPAYYVLKSDETNRKQIGFIAQDVKEVIPELVNGEEGTYSLAYAQFVPVVVNAIKEQQKQIDDLKHQIAELKAGLPGGK